MKSQAPYNIEGVAAGKKLAAAYRKQFGTPPELDKIADVVLSYRPKPKTKAAKRRKRRAQRARAKRR